MPAKLRKVSPTSSIQTRNVALLEGLEESARLKRSTPERIGDRVTAAAGQVWFSALHVMWFAVWIVINTGLIPGIKPFDPYPFSFLTFVVSLEAIFLSLTILMSQSHDAKQADKRAKLDLQINLLDERETTKLLQLVKLLCEAQGIPVENDPELKELCCDTQPDKILRDLELHDAPLRERLRP